MLHIWYCELFSDRRVEEGAESTVVWRPSICVSIPNGSNQNWHHHWRHSSRCKKSSHSFTIVCVHAHHFSTVPSLAPNTLLKESKNKKP